MTGKAKPHSLGPTIAVGLATAVAFAVLSLFFLCLQAKGNQHRLAGEVVAVSSENVSVKNARGDVTVLIIPVDAVLSTHHQHSNHMSAAIGLETLAQRYRQISMDRRQKLRIAKARDFHQQSQQHNNETTDL